MLLQAEFIVFPHTVSAFNQNKASFMEKFRISGVIGCIDGTHIAILKPQVEEHNFINRKGFHSLNVQIVCDSNLKILNLNANFLGSTHDSFIWRQSVVKQYLHDLYVQNRTRGVWLLGDSGYPLVPYLMTPFGNPEPNSPESQFNTRHASARNCVERCIGLLKMRFRCLLKERTARYSPQFVGRMTTACAVLHNICLLNDVPLPFLMDHEEPMHNEALPANIINNNFHLLNEGRRVRHEIVQRYYR